jgi:hypothetical protein
VFPSTGLLNSLFGILFWFSGFGKRWKQSVKFGTSSNSDSSCGSAHSVFHVTGVLISRCGISESCIFR